MVGPASPATLIHVSGASNAACVNVFIHGYRSMVSNADIESARRRVLSTGVAGESYLLNWMAGRWADSAAFAGLRTAYRVSRATRLFSPWALLADAGAVGVYEAAQFKRMERRAERVGHEELPGLLARVAAGRPINLIGHSLGARVVHRCLACDTSDQLNLNDAVLLAGAADLDSPDWEACVSRLTGRLYNAYSRKDRVLWMTPDLKRRVGSRPMRQVVVGGEPRVVNHHAVGVGHVRHWTQLAELLPRVWPGCTAERAESLPDQKDKTAARH